MQISKGERIFNFFNVLFLITFSIITLYPFWYVLILSFNEGQDGEMGGIWLITRKFTLDNYAFVIRNPKIYSAYIITISRVISGSLITLIVTGFASYVLARKRNTLPGMTVIITYLMIPMFIGGTIVSNYVVFAKIGLINNFLVYILPGSFNFFLMIVMRTYIQQIPDSLEESAKLDGANYIIIFVKIIFPLCLPIVATVLLFSGVGYWLDFYTNMVYVNKINLTTLQYLLYLVIRANQAEELLLEGAQFSLQDIKGLQDRTVTTESIKMATLMIVTLPILFTYPFLQKYFIKGLLIGSIKG